MAYPTHLLTDDESIVLELRPHWRALLVPITVLIVVIAATTAAWTLVDTAGVGWIVTLIAIVGVIPLTIVPFVRWRFTQYVLTSERLIVRSGVLARGGLEIPLENINDVRFSQRVIERVLGYGDVLIESAGSQGQSRIADVPDPEAFQSRIYRVREDRKLAFEGGAPRDAAAQLETLAGLHAKGVLTDEEFAAKKARLLDQI